MPLAGFEPTIPVFERAKTVHALDSEATVIGTTAHLKPQNALLQIIFFIIAIGETMMNFSDIRKPTGPFSNCMEVNGIKILNIFPLLH
jgi:hypothetical protein